MKKLKVYRLGIFYQQKIACVNQKEPKEFSFVDARYFRDQFKPLEDIGSEIEKDRLAIQESKSTNKDAELDKLWNEEVKVKVDKDLASRIEKAGINISISELELFE